MDLAAVLLLPLLGGYCFAYVWRGTAFRTRQVDGHHLYFRASLCGVILFSLSLALHTELLRELQAYGKFDLLVAEYTRSLLKDQAGLTGSDRIMRVNWVIAAIYSLLLGMTLGPVMNRFTSRGWALRRSASALYGFLVRAEQEEVPVALTLDASKVYIGFVTATLEPPWEPVVVTMALMFSGHRDAEGRVNLTTDYDTVYASLERGKAAQLNLPDNWPAQFELTIRADQIVTAGPFSPVIYTEFNPGWRQQIAREAKRAATEGEDPASEVAATEDQPEALSFPAYALSSIGTNLTFSGPM